MSKSFWAALAILGVFAICLFAIPEGAKADEPVDCTYEQAVISNYQEALTASQAETVFYKDALQRVSDNAVARNYEYAAAVEKIRKLKDKKRFWKTIAQRLLNK